MTRAHEAVLEGHVPDRQSLEKGVVHRIGLFGFSHALPPSGLAVDQSYLTGIAANSIKAVSVAIRARI